MNWQKKINILSLLFYFQRYWTGYLHLPLLRIRGLRAYILLGFVYIFSSFIAVFMIKYNINVKTSSTWLRLVLNTLMNWLIILLLKTLCKCFIMHRDRTYLSDCLYLSMLHIMAQWNFLLDVETSVACCKSSGVEICLIWKSGHIWKGIQS